MAVGKRTSWNGVSAGMSESPPAAPDGAREHRAHLRLGLAEASASGVVTLKVTASGALAAAAARRACRRCRGRAAGPPRPRLAEQAEAAAERKERRRRRPRRPRRRASPARRRRRRPSPGRTRRRSCDAAADEVAERRSASVESDVGEPQRQVLDSTLSKSLPPATAVLKAPRDRAGEALRLAARARGPFTKRRRVGRDCG